MSLAAVVQPDNCPTCGHEIALDADVMFDEESGIITGNGKAAYLTKTQMEFMILLRDRFPRIVSKESAMDAIYMGMADEPMIKIVDVYICKIRQRIAGIGVDIETLWGRGFRLKYKNNVA